jgi:hypothetical protein
MNISKPALLVAICVHVHGMYGYRVGRSGISAIIQVATTFAALWM